MTMRFAQTLRLMRSRNPQTAEDAFHTLRPHAGDYLREIVDAFYAEDDHGLRCWLLELIGEARSLTALPVLVEQLNGDDESLRGWAVRGLRKLDTRGAREALWHARSMGVPID
jgi:hypothetical protein